MSGASDGHTAASHRPIEDHPTKWIMGAIMVVGALVGGPEAARAVWREPRPDGPTPSERLAVLESKLDTAVAGIGELKSKAEDAAARTFTQSDQALYAAGQRSVDARQDGELGDLEQRVRGLEMR